MSPASKEYTTRGEIFIADGFSAHPEIAFQKFGVKRGDFSFGCFCTMWSISDGDRIVAGQPLLFDAMHDIGKGWSAETKKKARINAALQCARTFILDRERVNGGH